MHLAPGTIIAGRFRLEQALSRGGMSSLWIARHLQLGHPVAVKFMAPRYASSPAYRARFEREARAAANLLSPHIVQVQDYGIEDGMPWLVMELLHGEDLEEILQRRGRLPLHDAARILAQVGKALRRAHEAGIVHRDLKPGNLFLARVEDYEIVKVLDFGIAKDSRAQSKGQETQTGEVLGSPYYMSPEQMRGDKKLDHRSDLWSLGVILFRAIIGELPFPGDQLGTVMAKILVDPIPIPTAIAPDLPPAIDAFFARAFARVPGERFQSVQEMVDELSRIAGVSGTAMPPISQTFTPIGVGRDSAFARPAPAPDGPPGLTHGGMTGTGTTRALRSKPPWAIVAGGAALLVACVAAVTVARLSGSRSSEPAATSSEAAATSAPPPAVEASAPAASASAPAPSAAVTETPTATASPTAAPATSATPRTSTGVRRGSGRTDKWGVPLQ